MPATNRPFVEQSIKTAAAGLRPAISLKPFFIAWFLCLIVMQAIAAWNSKMLPLLDFRSFYSAGYLLRTDPAHLYNLERQKHVQDTLISNGDVAIPYFHPSYEALIYAPFSWLSYRTAYRSFQCFNLLMLLATFLYARDLFSDNIPFLQPRPGLLLLPFIPLLVAILQGQNSISLLFLLCAGWKCIRQDKDFIAGVLLAIGLFKFQIVLPIALLLSIRRGKRFAAGFLMAGAAVALISIAIVGPSGAASLIQLLHAASLAEDQGLATRFAMAIHPSSMPNINGLIYASGGRFLPARVAFIITATISVGLFGWCGFMLRRRITSEHAAFAISILCGLLISSHLYMHDATLLLLPIALTGIAHQRMIYALYGIPALLLCAGLGNLFFFFGVPVAIFLIIVTQATKPELEAPEEATIAITND